jgi:hypothetical protein
MGRGILAATNQINPLPNFEEDSMKKVTLAVLSMALVAALAVSAFAQKNPRGTSQITLNGKTVSVEYGRPSLNGRTTDQMLGKLQAGGVWRMGADTSTTFKTDADLNFDGTTVPAGEYSLWMQKQDNNSWKLVFNKEHGQWGTKHDAAQDLVSVALKESPSANPMDQVAITLTKSGAGGKIVVEWGTLKATANFTAK